MAQPPPRPPAQVRFLARPADESTSPWSSEKSFPPTISSTSTPSRLAWLAGFEQRNNAVAKALKLKVTNNDLDELLARIAAHEAAVPTLVPAAA